MRIDEDKPIVEEAKTFAALANLSVIGLIEYDESGENYNFTDKGFDRALELFEEHSDEEKILIMNLVDLMHFTIEQEEQ